MNSLIMWGAGALVACFAIWFVLRNAKRQGQVEQALKDVTLAKEAEEAIHEIQAEERPTSKTKRKLRDGTF